MLLPTTDFPQHVKSLHEREQSLQRLCSSGVYEWQLRHSASDAPLFVLHDGPPFANGRLHTGHFLNKVLKDIINRYKMMTGHKVHYVPVRRRRRNRAEHGIKAASAAHSLHLLLLLMYARVGTVTVCRSKSKRWIC